MFDELNTIAGWIYSMSRVIGNARYNMQWGSEGAVALNCCI